MQNLTITRPDDWHTHLRDGEYLKHTVPDMARYFGRAIVMPNLAPPVTTVDAAHAYRDRIVAQIPAGHSFEPLMTLYLTDQTTRDIVAAASESQSVHAFKLYPAGATTNSSAGINSIEPLYPVFEAMSELGVVLSIHGEVTDDDVDIFDREAVFIDRHLQDIVKQFPELKIILEHITTREAAQFVADATDNVAATITAHHLLYNRNDLLVGGIKPVYYCLPVLKRNTHQAALVEAATSGHPSFFLGTDSAPHPRHAKENACGCAAGCYTAHAALELYAEVFAAESALHQLEAFASFHGPDFYGLPRNTDTINLTETTWEVPEVIRLGADTMVPVRGGGQMMWQVS